MIILKINTTDNHGGAGVVAWNLFKSYQNMGLSTWMTVGEKFTQDKNVIIIQNDKPTLKKQSKKNNGLEDFDFPDTWELLNRIPQKHSLIHCHNLHGGYFDLRAIPMISQNFPVMLTLHDAWLLSGHCAHSLDCEKWKIGCGNCPDLSLYPAIDSDSTKYNWQRKQKIYSACRFYVTTPCNWLMEKVEQSMLMPSIIKSRVISNGVDLSVFQPEDKKKVRKELGIPKESKVLLFVGKNVKKNRWKDFSTINFAIEKVSKILKDKKILFIAIGGESSIEHFDSIEIRFVSYNDDQTHIAKYYQAADLYLHAANAETFPNTVIEALACGIPVIATGVGGIPEQIKSIRNDIEKNIFKTYNSDEATGLLVPSRDSEKMARAIVSFLTNSDLRLKLANNARKEACEKFDLKKQVRNYLSFYEEIIST